MRNPVLLVSAGCVAQILSMSGFATFPSLLPQFQEIWGLTNTEAGWINAIYFAGYLVAVLILVSLTDRIDPRRIYLACMALTVAAVGGFALFADGFWSALLFRALAGIGLAGTYMPGLKILSDNIEGPAQSRAVAFYTSSFGLGSSISYYLTGLAAEWMDWQQIFQLAAIGPAIAFVAVPFLLPAAPASRKVEGASLSIANFKRVLRNRGAMGYVLAYMAHNWELFGFRSWIVAFLVFIQRMRPGLVLPISPTTLAAAANLTSVPSSVMGNELATRFGRRRVASLIMFASALLAYALGFVAEQSGLTITLAIIAYGWMVTFESSTVTAGAVAEAEEGFRGMTMAVHSSIGFIGSFLGPLAFGVVLDASGGGAGFGSWGMAFTTMGFVVAMGPLMLLPLTRGSKTDSRHATTDSAADAH
ncbi:MAG: MFS transporter [SAR324 cluster bacterium]|nr:MFS transporter [SAR324 cluster bacterium]